MTYFGNILGSFKAEMVFSQKIRVTYLEKKHIKISNFSNEGKNFLLKNNLDDFYCFILKEMYV